MAWGTLRFMANGWVDTLFIEPTFFFKYYGFEWVQPLQKAGMYWVFVLMALSALAIMLGLFYRLATILFFLTFTYVELLDLSNYLNHYYLVCLLAFLLIWLPAGSAFSLDNRWFGQKPKTQIPAWMWYLLLFQLSLVYAYAGFAKLNADWLLRAMPLAVWLPEHSEFPLLGPVFARPLTPYLFSWAGALYDLTIPFLLLNRHTRPYAYLGVLIFHGLTGLLFNIGLFPYIMSLFTLTFFSEKWHLRFLQRLGYQAPALDRPVQVFPAFRLIGRPLLIGYLLLQVLFPLRYLAYPGSVLWTEAGYRFSWRVMLVEKVGHATFYVKDQATGRQTEVENHRFLTDFQEKQLAIQPDFLVQYAHFLKAHYQKQYHLEDPIVTADVFVALNGRPSQRFVRPEVDLASQRISFAFYDWIIPFKSEL